MLSQNSFTNDNFSNSMNIETTQSNSLSMFHIITFDLKNPIQSIILPSIFLISIEGEQFTLKIETISVSSHLSYFWLIWHKTDYFRTI